MELFRRDNKTIIEFGFCRMWRILRILEGIFHQGERWLLNPQNSSYPTQPHSIIAKSLEYICDPPQDFNAKGESTRMTRFHFKTKEFILTRFSTLTILPH